MNILVHLDLHRASVDDLVYTFGLVEFIKDPSAHDGL